MHLTPGVNQFELRDIGINCAYINVVGGYLLEVVFINSFKMSCTIDQSFLKRIFLIISIKFTFC